MTTVFRRVSVLAVLVLVVVTAGAAIRSARDDRARDYMGQDGWPTRGQAAYAIGTGSPHVSAAQRRVPIASLAKVMTALLVLRHAPLADGAPGFELTVTAQDVEDTARRHDNGESLVAVAEGEVLTERQALIALLLPSANNVAIMLARHVGGTVAAFVAGMNRAARAYRMRHTTYTDPSGLLASTRSTAADQLILARIAMQNNTFAALVAMEQATLPVAGTIQNTDRLLGTNGFVGIKTGSDDAAEGCFMFRAVRETSGGTTTITGVVLGQPGDNLVVTGQYAALQLVDRVAPVG